MSAIITAGSVRLDSYNGNATVVFGTDPNPGRNFSFGRAKACLLLDAIASHGVDAVLALVATVAGRTQGQGDATPTDKGAFAPDTTTPLMERASVNPRARADAAKVSVPPVKDVFAGIANHIATMEDDTPIVVSGMVSARPDTATVATSTVPPVKAKAKASTTPKAESKSAERARLVKAVQDAGLKGHGLAYKWKLETLRAKVAEIPVSATPAPKAETPISDKDLNRGLALAGIKSTESPKAEPTIVHTATIKGKTYVLLNTGETKLKVNRTDGKLQLRKTDMVLSIPPKSDEKTVLRTFRDGSTQFVLYTDGTWKAVERVDRSV